MSVPGPPRSPVHIVLAGGGHSHLEVLRRFGLSRPPGVRLTVVTREIDAPYSGMLPGLVAGHYTFDEAHVDVRRLGGTVGARVVHDEIRAVDVERRLVVCAGRPPIGFDLLSINVGATPSATTVPLDAVVAVKPIAGFLDRWESLRDRVRGAAGPVRVAVVGGGAGGVELLLAVQYALQAASRSGPASPPVRYVLFSASPGLVPGHHARVRDQLTGVLRARGVDVHTGHTVVSVGDGWLRTSDGVRHDADEVLWATEVAAAPWLRTSGLAVDARGFVRVSATLESVSHPGVFAAGDCASLDGYDLAKSGVYAVRQGPVLAGNLWRAARGEPLRRYRPQQRFLSLISTGDRMAVASRGRWSAHGAWVWRLKDRIDRRFMAMYQAAAPMPVPPPSLDVAASSASGAAMGVATAAMRCGGCGAKVGATVLRRVLRRIRQAAGPDVLVGLDAGDDAAVIAVPDGYALVQTVDLFRPLLDDPYLFAKLAATHALGDVYAMGGVPRSALATVTVPFAGDDEIERVLGDVMGGIVDVLGAEGVTLVGGHTSEGAELAVGLTVNGLVRPDAVLRKDGLRTGDVLILTKALGTGALFAADRQQRAKGRWIARALDAMLRSNGPAAACLRAHGAQACTDVTGFGLAGHLLEMAEGAGMAVELWPSAVPRLGGVDDVMREGIRSTLQPENERLSSSVGGLGRGWSSDPALAVLFDPQTAGGLLAGVSAVRADACVEALRASGAVDAAIVGRVRGPLSGGLPVTLAARPGGS